MNNIQGLLEAVGKAYKKLREHFFDNVSSGELFEAFQQSLQNSLGDYEIVYDYIWGKDSLKVDGVTDEKYIPQNGDTLIMDISVGKNGIWCDVCRTFFVGAPSTEHRNAYELIKATLRAGHKALKCGVTACDIFKSVNTVYELNGKKLIHHAGHRIGEKPLLQPQFLIDNETLLVPGELYTIESGLYEKFGIRLENDFLLTEDGAIDLFEDLMPLEIEEYILQ